jgi:hypothetical protein
MRFGPDRNFMKKFPRSITLVSDYRSRVLRLGCLLWMMTVAVVGAFWPFAATQENPFAGKLFVEERQEEQYTGFRTRGWDQGIAGDIFEFYSFASPSTVTRGRGAFLIYDGSGDRNRYWFPVARLVDKSIVYPGTYVAEDSIKNQSYTVDASTKLITFDSKESYVYEVSGKVITLKSDIKTKTLYEIETPFFLTDKTSNFWSGDQAVEPSFPESMDFHEERKAFAELNDKIVKHHRNYFDNLIGKAKGAPPVPLPVVYPDPPTPYPTPSPTPSPTPPVVAIASSSATAIATQPTPVADESDEDKEEEPRRPAGQELVDGKYDGVLVNEITGANDKIEIRVESKSEPSSGTPPTAPIKVSTLLPEAGRGDEELWGVATYGTPTALSFGWKNQTGTAKFEGKLEGEKLSGTWSVEGVNGEAGRGTFEATKSKL